MKELRKSFFNKVEFRTTESEGKRIIEAVIPYNSKSADLGGYREVITPTAFSRTLKEGKNVFCFFNHDSNKILASTKSGTLELESRNEGLFCKIYLGDTTDANNAWGIISRGDCTTLSFCFKPHEVENRGNLQYLRSVELIEVSLCVAFPAYEETASVSYIRNKKDYINMKEKLFTRSLNVEMLQEIIESGEKVTDPAAVEELLSLADPEVLKTVLQKFAEPTGGDTAKEEKESREEKEEIISEEQKKEILELIEEEIKKETSEEKEEKE
jgi:HK97 family phage prohead protease